MTSCFIILLRRFTIDFCCYFCFSCRLSVTNWDRVPLLHASPPPLVTVTPVSSLCVSVLFPALRLAAFTAALALDALSSSVATNSDTATATLDPTQDSPSSETTTLTCSLSTPANEPPDPSPAPAPSPESSGDLTSAVEAKVAPPLVAARRSSGSAEVKDKKVAPPPPAAASPQKPETPIPPKRRHSPKLAALNAKNSPPVSPLATSSACSSPSFETRKPAPRPPVDKPPVQPSAEPPPQKLESNPDAPARSSSSRPSVQEAVDPAALLADVASPLPITSIPAPSSYDALAPTDFDLELTNGTATPSAIPEDLISLESPPPVPTLANGDGADLPPHAPETLAKTAPPVNDEYGSL